jgi:hypothetical protein
MSIASRALSLIARLSGSLVPERHHLRPCSPISIARKMLLQWRRDLPPTPSRSSFAPSI